MLRITELKLPLDHSEAALPAAILARLAIKAEDLLGFTVFRRGYDSRKKRTSSSFTRSMWNCPRRWRRRC